MEDKKLEALEQASFYWQKAFYADNLTKLAYAADLHKYEIFSLNQIAKICRVRPVELSRYHLKPNAKGGRFEPETLTALAAMRRSHLKGDKVSPKLIEICVNGGTSFSCATALTGIAYSSYYKDVPEKVERLRLKPTDRMAIVKALRAGAQAELLAGQYGITVENVLEISRTHENV